MGDGAATGSGRGPGVAVALDIQALQSRGRPRSEWPGWPGWPPGSTPLRDIQAYVAAHADALARSGRLAAALLAPEYPAPDVSCLPDGLLASGAVRWDRRAEVRRLVRLAAAGGTGRPVLAHHVPAPFLDTDFGDPAGQVVGADWAEAGVPRVVTVHDLDPLEEPQRWLQSPSRQARYRARAEWVAESDVIVAVDGRAADQVVRLLGFPPERLVVGTGADLVDGIVDALGRRLPGGQAGSGVTRPGSGAARPRSGPDRPTRGADRPTAPADLPVALALVGPFPPHGGGIGAYNGDLIAALASPGRPTPGGPDPGGPAPAPRVDAVATPAEAWAGADRGWRPPAGVRKLHPESLGRDIRPAGYDHLVYTIGNSSGHLATVETALRHPGWLWLHETRLPAVATTALEGLGDEEFRARMEWLLERAYPDRAPLASAAAAGRSHLALAGAGVGLAGLLVARSAGVLVNSTAARNFLLLDLPPLAWHPPVRVLPPGCPPVRPLGAGRRPRRSGGRPLAVAFGVVSMSKRPDVMVDAAARGGFDLAFVGPCPPILAELIDNRARHLGIPERVEVAGAVDDGQWWGWMGRATVAVQLREESSGEISAAVLDALAAGVPVVTNLPAASDYPEATVAMLPGGAGAPPDPDDVAAVVDRLVGDPDGLEGLSRAGQDYASGHQMSDLARALLEAVTSTDP